MKTIQRIILGLILLASGFSYAQQVQLITSDEQRPTFEGKSYLVIKSLTLKQGFIVNAATNGSWYAKAHPNAVPPVAPSDDQNYVRSESVLKSGITNEGQVRGLTIADKSTAYSYLDGVGRGLQSTIVSASPGLNDVVQPTYYDALGRPARQYLPYVAGSGVSGSFRPNALADQVAFYNLPPAKVQSDSRAYSEVSYDNSPLGRIVQSTATGSAWSAKPVTNNFRINDANTVTVQEWRVVNNLPVSNSTYPTGSLVITEVTNEEGTISRSYADFLGRTVLKESQTTANNWAKTYYVYDLAGHVQFIIPPAAAANLTPDQAYADRWYFQYEYDAHQRQVGFKAPGTGTSTVTGWVYTIYDQWERPVLTQDGNQRSKSPAEWSFVKYDDLNRTVATGIYRTNELRSTLISNLTTFPVRYEVRDASAVGYTLNRTFPTTVTEADLLAITYYDNYTYLNNAGWDVEGNSFAFVAEPGYTSTPFTVFDAQKGINEIKDVTTGGKVKIVGTNSWLNSVTYYDNRYRPLQTISENHFSAINSGKTDRVTSEYDFAGTVLKTKRVHNGTTQSFTIQERFTYDLSGRLLNTYHQLGNQPEVLLSAMEYNALGQLIDKKIHSTDDGSSWLQSLDYRYNIRGWNTNINNTTADAGDPVDYFGMDLAYNNAQSGNFPRYDGLISGTRVKLDVSAKDRIYNYTYDKGSLTGAAYKVDNTPNTQTGIFNENISYDLNGNIQTLNRNSGLLTAATTDQLTYNYGTNGGNQLMNVTDAYATPAGGFVNGTNTANDYAYDANGNLTQDLNKGITSISYNLLNLPERVTFSNGYYLLYQYDASGAKLSQAYYSNTNVPQVKTDYEGEFLYVNGQPEVIFHSQGRLVGPSGANLISNTATREANTLAGYTANGRVTLTAETLNGENYIKAVSNQNGSTAGVWPIGGAISVKAGESYSFKIDGYQTVGSNAYLYVWGNTGDLVWQGAQLPVGSTSGLVSSSFTVPSGVAQIKVGVLWSNAASGNTLYINRVMLYKSDWEYQYFLSDHLGSPRVVLQTTPGTSTYTATMENKNFGAESSQFLNMVSGREVGVFNTTPGGTYSYVMNSANHTGPAKSFRVLPGDVINASVMAYYPSGGTYSKTALSSVAGYVVTALTGGVAGAVDRVVNTSYDYSISGTDPNFLLSPNQGTGKPSAFINYILFDETYTPLEAKSTPVGNTAGVLHQITLPQINVSQTGYLYVYLSYDNEAGGMDVYFDDFSITYAESPVVQVNNYYAYGLPAFSWVRSGEYENKFLFQGKEQVDQTGWQDFHARQYDPVLGRWFAADPKGSAMPYNSMYAAMMNNPVMFTDPDGKCPICIPIAIGALFGGFYGAHQADNNGGKWYDGAWKGALVGAAGGAAGFFAPAGILPGIGYGTATGAVLGAGQAALYGTDIWKGVMIGSITGAISGGVNGGISSLQDGKTLMTGRYKPLEYVLPDGFIFNPETALPSSDADASRLMSKHFGIDYNEKFGVRTLTSTHEPFAYKWKDGSFVSMHGKYKGQLIAAVTMRQKGGVADIYLAKSAFSSEYHFFEVAGHELIHSYHHHIGLSLVYPNSHHDFSENAAYSWLYRVAVTNGRSGDAAIFERLIGKDFYWRQNPLYNWRNISDFPLSPK